MNLNKHMKFNGAENHPSGVFQLDVKFWNPSVD